MEYIQIQFLKKEVPQGYIPQNETQQMILLICTLGNGLWVGSKLSLYKQVFLIVERHNLCQTLLFGGHSHFHIGQWHNFKIPNLIQKQWLKGRHTTS
jgi:hypothetical protein